MVAKGSHVSINVARALRDAQARTIALQEHQSDNWLEYTYRQHLLGGWKREDTTIAPPHIKAFAFHEAEKALFCPGLPNAQACSAYLGQIGSDYNQTWDCPKCKAKGLRIPPKRTEPGIFLVGAPSYSKHFPLTNNPYIEKRLDKHIARKVKGQTGVTVMYEMQDGSEIHCLSYEQDIRKGKAATSAFEGSAWDGAWLDEPPPRSAWIGIKRGLMGSSSKYARFPFVQRHQILFAAGGNRSSKSYSGASAFSAMVLGKRPWDGTIALPYGRTFITATPLECPWLFHEIYRKAYNKGGDSRHIFAMEFEIYDNPSLTKETIDTIFRDGMSEDEVSARIYGRFRFLSGRVFPEFDTTHIYRSENFDPLRLDYRPENNEPSDCPIIMAVDPHHKKPWMMAWFAVMPDGTFACVREWPNSPYEKLKTCDMGYDDYARQIAEIEAEFPGGRERVMWREIDPNISRTPHQSASGSSTIGKELRSRGYYFRDDVNDKISHGHSIIHTLLAYNTEQPIDEMNRPKFIVEENARNVIFAFENYCWEEQEDISKASKDKPKDLGKDAMDVVRYAMTREPTFVPWTSRGASYDAQLVRRLAAKNNRGF